MKVENGIILEGFVLRDFGGGLVDFKITLDDRDFSKVDFIIGRFDME